MGGSARRAGARRACHLQLLARPRRRPGPHGKQHAGAASHGKQPGRARRGHGERRQDPGCAGARERPGQRRLRVRHIFWHHPPGADRRGHLQGDRNRAPHAAAPRGQPRPRGASPGRDQGRCEAGGAPRQQQENLILVTVGQQWRGRRRRRRGGGGQRRRVGCGLRLEEQRQVV